MKTIYKATCNRSEDGRGENDTLGYFINRSDAELATKGQSSWGKDGSVSSVKLYESFEDYSGYAPGEHPENIKQEALKKLTTKEKRLLGLLPE